MTTPQRGAQTAPIDSGYAWLRLGAALVVTTVGCAGMYISMVGLPAYQAEFEITRGAASLPFTLVMLGFGIGGVLIGRAVDRYGIVLPLAVSTILLALTLLGAAQADGFAWFAVAHFGLGAFGCAAVFSPLMADISKWFERRRGLAIALCASGNYLAGTVWPPVVGATIQSWGWRATYVGVALVSLAVMLPLLALMRRRPTGGVPAVAGGGSRGNASMLGVSPQVLVMLLSLAGVGCCMAMAMPQAHVVSLASDLGLGITHGTQMLSLMFGLGILSRVVFGWISDRIGGLQTLLVGSAAQCLALTIFLPADTLTALYVASGLFGLFQGGIVPCYALIVREYFPEADAGTFIGVVVLATLIGMAGGGWISGVIYDVTASYDIAFVHGIAWNLVNMLVIGFLVLRYRAAIGQSRD